MNRQFFIAWLAVFIAWFLGDFVIHGVLLRSDYEHMQNLFRPEAEAQKYFPFMLVAHVLLAAAFTWIYSRGVEARPWVAQGARFGVAVALLTCIPMYMIYYVVQPMPPDMVVRQIVYSTVLMVVVGAVAAFMYRSRTE